MTYVYSNHRFKQDASLTYWECYYCKFDLSPIDMNLLMRGSISLQNCTAVPPSGALNDGNHDLRVHTNSCTWICSRCDEQFGDDYVHDYRKQGWPDFNFCTGWIAAPPPSKPKCRACAAELSPYMDAYYGHDPLEAARCIKCRSNRGIL